MGKTNKLETSIECEEYVVIGGIGTTAEDDSMLLVSNKCQLLEVDREMSQSLTSCL